MDPTQPTSREDNQQWARVHHFNKESANASDDVDVVFLGDSITEGWSGTAWGRTNAKVHSVPQVFQSYFSIEHGGDYEGLALGIAGDSVRTCSVLFVGHIKVKPGCTTNAHTARCLTVSQLAVAHSKWRTSRQLESTSNMGLDWHQ